MSGKGSFSSSLMVTSHCPHLEEETGKLLIKDTNPIYEVSVSSPKFSP